MAFKLSMNVDLCIRYILMVILMTLTLMQGHSGSAEKQNQLELSQLLSKQKRLNLCQW